MFSTTLPIARGTSASLSSRIRAWMRSASPRFADLVLISSFTAEQYITVA